MRCDIVLLVDEYVATELEVRSVLGFKSVYFFKTVR